MFGGDGIKSLLNDAVRERGGTVSTKGDRENSGDEADDMGGSSGGSGVGDGWVEVEKEGEDARGGSGEDGDEGDEAREETEDEWLDVLGSGTLMKKEVRRGKGRDTRPARGQLARYTLRVTVNGVPAASSSADDAPRDAIVGENDDALALDLVLPLMELGEVCEVKTNPRYDNRVVPSSSSRSLTHRPCPTCLASSASPERR
jgi:uncharacterized protein (DUF736 family)